ncbi:hypothetical protein ACT453_35110, partial [Bacillus sp. D-CC]
LKDIALAGGSFLNILANSKIYNSSFFDSVSLPSALGPNSERPEQRANIFPSNINFATSWVFVFLNEMKF